MRTARQFGHFIGGAWPPPARRVVRHHQPGHRRSRSRRSPRASRADVDARGGARRARRSPAGGPWAGTAARATSTRSRAHVQQQRAPARGARVARQRQADPRDRATSTSRSWPGTSITTPAGPSSWTASFRATDAGRRRGADHPLELPAADAGVEDRAGAGHREHGRAQAGRVHLAHGAAVRRAVRARRGCPPAWSTSSPATGAPARRSWRIPTSTRSPSPARPRSAASSAWRPPAPARSCRSSWAGSRPSSCSTTPTSTAWSKAWWTPSGSTRGRSAAPARACWCRRAIAERLVGEAQGADGDAARRRSRSTRRWTSGAIVAPVQLERIRALVANRARTEGARSGSRRGAARPRAASTRRRCSPTWRPSATIAQVEIFGPVLVAMTLPHARRGGGAGQQHAATASRRASGPRTSTSRSTSRRSSRPASVWINCTNLFDAAAGFGGYRESGLRARGWPGRDVGVREARPGSGAAGQRGRTRRSRREPRPRRRPSGGPPSPSPSTSIAPPSSTSAASRCAPTPATASPVHRAAAASAGRGRARATARTSATRSRRRTRRTGLGPRHGAPPGPDPLLHRRESLGAADEFAARIARADRRPGDGPAEVDALASRGSSPTPPGPTSATAGCTRRRSATSRSR